MTYTELIERISDESKVKRKDVAMLLGYLTEVIAQALERREQVQVRNLGTFVVRTRAARHVVNPRTGEDIYMDAIVTPGFRAGTTLKRRIHNLGKCTPGIDDGQGRNC